MLFNSIEFLFFLPIVFCLYWFVFNKKLIWQNALVLLASYFFYGWWSWKFMGLLMLSTLLDYTYGFWVASPNRKKAKLFLWLSIINNLGILAVFKYYNFFAEQFQLAFQQLGLHLDVVLLNIALPVGISFYTFHGMSYVFDIYREQQKPVKNFIDYAVFVSFFPLLVAGPIERANHLLPQIQKNRCFSLNQAKDGCRMILWGFYKKIVIADTLALIADPIFANYSNHNSITLIIAALAFSFQIYADFSGYSDIALGVAKLFGFELLKNFQFPYFSRNIVEFWKRWHISLSSWFRDYLYIPLGGSKRGLSITIRNTLIIFLVSGFWHGASWNFIVWGGIHALAFVPYLFFGKNQIIESSVVASYRSLPNLKELRQMFITFCFVTLAWIFFRMSDFGDAINYLNKIFYFKIDSDLNLSNSEYLMMLIAFGHLLIMLFSEWFSRTGENSILSLFSQQPRFMRWGFYVIILFFVILYIKQETSSFIYFAF